MVVVLVLAACSGDDDADGASPSSAPETSTTSTVEPAPEHEPLPFDVALAIEGPGNARYEVFEDPDAGVDPARWQTETWVGSMEIETDHEPSRVQIEGDALVIAEFGDGREGVPVVNQRGAFLGWFVIGSGEASFVLDLDGDGGVDFHEAVQDDLTKTWVQSPLGRAFSQATAAGLPFDACPGIDDMDVSGLHAIGIPCGDVDTFQRFRAQPYDNVQQFQHANQCRPPGPLDALTEEIGADRVEAAQQLREDIEALGAGDVVGAALFSTGVFEWMKFSPPPDRLGDPLGNWARRKTHEEFTGESGVEKIQAITDSELLRLATRTLSDLTEEAPDAIRVAFALSKRPSLTCEQRAPDEFAGKLGSSDGDPHFRTFDGRSYSYQGVGDFVGLVSDDERFSVHLRFRPIGPSVSGTAAAAIGYDGDVVHVDRDGVHVGDRLLADGDVEVLPSGMVAEADSVRLPDGTTVRNRATTVVNLEIGLSPVWFGSVEGLYGDADDDVSNDLRVRGSDTVVDADDLYRDFGESWRLDADETLLRYGPGEDPETFHDRAFPSVELDLSDEELDAARATCAAAGVLVEPIRSQCALDLAATGDPGFVASAAARAAAVTASVDLPTRPVVEIGPDMGNGFGIVEGPGRYDVYGIDVEAGRRVEVLPVRSAFEDCAIGAWFLSATVQFVDETGEPLTEAMGLSSNCSRFDLVLEPRTTGRVFLVVAGVPADRWATSAGPYGLAIHRSEPHQVFPATVPFSTDELPHEGAGRFETAGSVDRYRFAADAGETIHIQTVSDGDGRCSLGPGSAFSMQLLSPGGDEMLDAGSTSTVQSVDDVGTVHWPDNCANTFRVPYEVVAPTTGEYELIVASRAHFASEMTGSYGLRIATDAGDLLR